MLFHLFSCGFPRFTGLFEVFHHVRELDHRFTGPGSVRGLFGIRSGFVRSLSGSVQGACGIRLGSVRDPFGVRSGSVGVPFGFHLRSENAY